MANTYESELSAHELVERAWRMDAGGGPATPSGYPEHDLVRIHGLVQNPDLNGQMAGIVNMPPTADGRIGLGLCGSPLKILVKRENIVPLKCEWIMDEDGNQPGTLRMYRSIEGARRRDPNASGRIVTLNDDTKHEMWVPGWFPAPKHLTATPVVLNNTPTPTMGIGEGTDEDPFAGLKQHMEAAGCDTSNFQTFRMEAGARGTGATLEECLANAQASTEAPAREA